MNQTEQILLQAIQKSLWNKDIAFPEDTNWDAVLKEAESQSVLGIAIGSAPIQFQPTELAKILLILFAFFIVRKICVGY